METYEYGSEYIREHLLQQHTIQTTSVSPLRYVCRTCEIRRRLPMSSDKETVAYLKKK